MNSNFTRIELDAHCHVLVGRVDQQELATEETFADLWQLRPNTAQHVVIAQRMVAIPRRQRAYGRDYAFSGNVAQAHPTPELLAKFLAWSRGVDLQLNGLLVNWYDAEFKERIGRHRDETRGLVEGTPIVTISLGAPRTFRLREFRGEAQRDLTVENGTVVVVPWITNKRWTHEVPHFARDAGRRISITLRAFTSVV